MTPQAATTAIAPKLLAQTMPNTLKTTSDTIEVAESPPGTQNSTVTTDYPGKSTDSGCISAMRTGDEGISKTAPKPMDTPIDQMDSEITMEPTMENIIEVMQSVHDLLHEKVLRNEQKNNARNKMSWAIKYVKARCTPTTLQNTPEENAGYKEIITELAEIKKAVKQTYAQAVQKAEIKNVAVTSHTGETSHASATGHKHGTDHTHAHATAQVNKEQDKCRSEEAKKDVILTTRDASDDMKKKIANIEEEAITKNLLELIQKDPRTANIKIQSTRKLAKHVVRIRCHTESDAKQIREVNWKELLEGTTVMNTEYGIVMHGVPKHLMSNIEEFKTNMECANHIKVRRVSPLRRNARNPDAPTQSIVIFMESPEEANKCIDDAVIIAARLHEAQRYIPQCQIKQCFNCQAYGHKADTCKKKTVCGKCAEEHETRKCTSEEMKCANCKNAHAAWSHECSKRKEISQKMETRRAEIPTSFSC